MAYKNACVLFPGQGAQAVGMGKTLCQDYVLASKTFAEAEEVTGFDLRRIAFDGPKEELDKTLYSQLCLLTHSVAVLRVWQEKHKDVSFQYFGGLSLGEYSAQVAAGVLQFKDALLLVKDRALLMQEACDTHKGGMVSVIGLDIVAVHEVLENLVEGKMTVANLNCPGQIVVSGDSVAQREVVAKVKEKGAKLAVVLSVAGAFHSWHMDSAAQAFLQKLTKVCIQKRPLTRVLSNYSGTFYKDSDDWSHMMSCQINHPVRFESNLKSVIEKGGDHFVEMGSGKTIAGMLKRTDKSKVCENYNDSVDFSRYER